MAEVDSVPQDIEQAHERQNAADIIVGIPGTAEDETLSHVVSAAKTGLQQYFDTFRGIIVNAQGGRPDISASEPLALPQPGEAPVVRIGYPIYPVHKLSIPYHGIPGKGSAFESIFLLAQKLEVSACVIVEPDISSTTPEWFEALLTPIVSDNFDFVTSCYVRKKYDGALINTVVYPLFRTLYGKRIRQPIGGAFAFSRRLIDYYLEQQPWDAETTGTGIDTWVATQAVWGGFKIAQSLVGPMVQTPRDPMPELSTVLAQVVGSIYSEMNRTMSLWQKAKGSEPVPWFGVDSEFFTDAAPVDVSRMIESFRLGHQDLQGLWGLVLPPATLLELNKLARRSKEEFKFGDAVWARIVYDFALGYRLRVMDRNHLLSAMAPLYLGWIASYFLQLEQLEPAGVENRLEALSLAYELQKPYLISRWRWPDRFNP